uniref:Uncharacterized protein n=1 Tax=Anguilla anguilla TaxID=7936 RepID=A0A0E9R1T6_ANGAN
MLLIGTSEMLHLHLVSFRVLLCQHCGERENLSMPELS